MALLRESGLWFALVALLLLPATAMAKGEKTDPEEANTIYRGSGPGGACDPGRRQRRPRDPRRPTFGP